MLHVSAFPIERVHVEPHTHFLGSPTEPLCIFGQKSRFWGEIGPVGMELIIQTQFGTRSPLMIRYTKSQQLVSR